MERAGNIHSIAKASLVKDRDGKKVLKSENGLTKDIIKEILATYHDSWKQTKEFARQLQGSTTEETCNNVWTFVKGIKYKLDPQGIQWIKTPARTIADGFGDCKAYSILTCSILNNLGIDCDFRFASYSGVSDHYTHVYTLAKDKGRNYIIDACLPSFNEEKPYSSKLDKMTKIYRLSGVGNAGLVTTPYEIDPEGNAGELSLLLLRERLELEQQIARSMAGIGTTLDKTYSYDLALVNEALRNVNQPELISGIGSAIGKTKVGKLLKKAGNTLKKSVKVAAKVVTAPVRLATKGVLEVALPKTAPAFLYLFLTPAQLSSAPAKVKRKQAKASKIARFITEVIGMKQDHFMGIIRNGIMKQMGRTPEQLINNRMKISGIGVAPLLAAAVPALMELLKKIASLFKKNNGESYTAEDLPAESDWSEFLTTNVKSAPTAQRVTVPRLVESNSETTADGTTITVKSLQTEPLVEETAESREEGRDPVNESSSGSGFEFKPWMLAVAAGGAFLLLKK